MFWVAVSAFSVAILLMAATWQMNFWPTDAEDYYISAAVRLPALDFVSQMHDSVDVARIRWLHGKEVFIINTALAQTIFNDYVSLRPLVFICIFSVVFSAVLLFLLARGFWGPGVGGVCFTIFLTSFWPYVYVLFVKHQPLGLFYFLFSVFFLFCIRKTTIPRWILLSISGLTLCLSIFASTVSLLYIPFYVAAFFVCFSDLKSETLGRLKKTVIGFFQAALMSLLGFLAMFIYLTFPDVAHNVKGFIEYANISKSFSHFYYNQPVLIQWIAHPELSVRGGWEWVIKYFLTVMPVLFPVYLLSFAYLVWRWVTIKKDAIKFRISSLVVILLSVSSPILAEWRGVAQYGSNYFTSFLGIILLVGFSLYHFWESCWVQKAGRLKKIILIVCGCVILAVHAGVNMFIFLDDVYPSRMATTFISQEIKKLGVHELNSYMDHPCRLNIVDCLQPSLLSQLRFLGIANIYQAKGGYILVPPIAGNSIYIDSTRNTYSDFDKDMYLNQLFRSGKINDYIVATFKTLSSSRIWRHEEEILSYRDFILKQDLLSGPLRGKALLLDAAKLRSDFKSNPPHPDDVHLVFNGVRNIGVKTMIYVYEGERKSVEKPTLLKTFVMRMYKVGNPKDQLIAYIYRPDLNEPVWIPFSGNFASRPLDGQSLSSDPQGASVTFHFSKPLGLLPGPYRIVIYRTGPADDSHFYRIYTNSPEIIEAGIESTKILPP